MRRFKLVSVTVVLVALLTAAVAIAKNGNQRHTDPVMAEFSVTQQSVSDRTCTGTDGEYRAFHARYQGTSTGDPRLTGNVTIKSKGLINQTTGFGSSRGTVVIRGTDGKVKASGHYHAVNTNLGVLHGFVVGRVKDQGTGGEETSGRGWIYANFKGAFNATGTVLTGQLGGTAADPRTPAVIQSGSCGKKNR